MTDTEYAHLRIRHDTHKRVKVAAARAGMTHDQIVQYMLELLASYPPTQDYLATRKEAKVSLGYL